MTLTLALTKVWLSMCDNPGNIVQPGYVTEVPFSTKRLALVELLVALCRHATAQTHAAMPRALWLRLSEWITDYPHSNMYHNGG